MASPNSTLPNDEKKARDSHYNPGEHSYREGMGAGYVGAGADQAEAFANDPANHDSAEGIRDAENKGSWNNNVSSSYGGNRSKSGQGISRANFRAVLKKRGPLAAVLTLLLGGGIGAGMFFGPSLLLVQIQESFLSKFDTQNTSMTIRTNKILANKLVGQNTSGSCDSIQIACRFSRPSNKLLGNLEKNGVVALAKDGTKISKTGLFQKDRPAKYIFNGKPILAENFATELRSNSAFRAAFHKAYNPKYVGFTDSVFKTIKGRFGFDTSNRDAKSGTGTEKERLNKASKGAAVASDAAASSETVVKDILNKKLQALLKKIGGSGKGDTVGLVAGTVCAGADIPKILVSTARAYQVAQVVNYSMQFLIAGSALKAGAITQEQAAGLGALLTTAVGTKTAMDSFGMKYAMFGDTKPTDNSSTLSFNKFIPGGGAVNIFGGAAQALATPGIQKSCQIATNPATGAAVNAAFAAAAPETFGISLLGIAINVGIGFTASAVIEQVSGPLITMLLAHVNLEQVLGLFLGNLTQDLAGQDVGNALTSGVSNMMSMTANAGGNMPLTVNQAIAYNQTAKDVNIAYAQEDTATHSPLDPTNPNTMVGSMIGKLIPYFANITSASSMFSSILSVPFGSFATLLHSTTASAVSAADQYTLCSDPAIKDSGAAAGPFCNVQYGIPTEYLNMDPQQIVDSLVSSGDIDAQSGEPVLGKGLSDWLTNCTDGSTDQLQNCQINNSDGNGSDLVQKKAMYSLYAIDHRIQKTMDGEDTPADQNTSTASTAGATIDQAHIYDDSTSIACAAGTTDVGINQGYLKGKEVNVRLCSIPNTIDYGYDTNGKGPIRVNSRVSGAVLAMVTALIASSANRFGAVLHVSDSFRSMAGQQAAFAQYGSPLAASAGYSNHQMGLAIDFQLGSNKGVTRVGDPAYDWLVANAKSYGFGKLSSEAWHWQPFAAQGSVQM